MKSSQPGGCAANTCSQGVYRGAFWAVNRPPCIVEVHTSVAKASFGLGSIFRAVVQIYYTGAHKSHERNLHSILTSL